ncbi:MAG: phage tail tape measure protein [Rhodobacteraceae bacterium]|nr:phage tail tape measure protein [Paracoccaceae bacterium]
MSNATRNYTIRLSASGKQQLEADLRALGASGEKSLRRIQTATKPANTGLRETDRAARELKGSLGAVSAELPALARLARFMGTTALAGGIVAFGRSSLNVGREFQAMMQRVEAATRAGGADMGRLSDAAKALGATTAFTAMQAAEAIEVLAKNGVSVADILDGALSSSVSLASALGAEMAPAADLVTDLMQQFSLEAGQLPDIVDQVTGAALKSKFGFDDLRLAIGQAGGVAGTSGVEIEDFLTVLAATSSSFASGSDAGTSFKTFLQRLTPESKKAAAVMAELDLAFFDAQGNMKSMTEIAQVLQDGLANLSEEARNDALKTVFGTDAIRTAAALAKQGAEGMRELAQGIGEVSAQEQAEVRLRGLDGALKEVAAAWEALQLEAAENGGLDVAESFVRRLTEALRFLTENFQEVEEIAERVAQALTVYLVGKGMTLAIAKGVALRATLIEIAGAATGVGTAASRAAGPLTRMGIAARALTGVLGGPLSLAITAGSLIAFGLDTDATADALDRAVTAASSAGEALDAYQEAARRAAEEQKGLGGEISATTQQMLAQSRAALEQARADLERSYMDARGAMTGSLLDGDGIDDLRARLGAAASLDGSDRSDLEALLWPDDAQNDFLARMYELAQAVEEGRMGFSEFMAEVDALRAVGSNLEPVRDRLVDILDSGDRLVGSGAVEELMALAREAGLFADEIAAIDNATTESDAAQAIDDLARALTEALEAGKLLRSEGLEGFREKAGDLAEVETQLQAINDRLTDNRDLSEQISGDRPFDDAGDSARGAADEIARLNRVYGQYQATRIAGDAQNGPSMQPWGEPTSSFSREGMDPAAIRALAVLEQASGKLFNILSDYRSPEENKAAGGAKHSQHMSGKAFDIDVSGMSIDERLELIKLARSVAGFGGVGVYSSSLHFDTGPERAWGPDYTSASVPGWAAETLGMYGKDSKGGSTKTEELDKQAEALARVVSVGRDQLDQLRLEADLAGRSVEQQAQLTFQYEALKRAREAGIDPAKTTTEDGRILADVIDEQAAAYGRLVAAKDADARKSEETKEKNQKLADEIATYKGEISALFDNLKPGGDGIAGFWDDLTSMILDKLWTLAFDPVWNYLAQLMQSMFSGLGGGSGLLSVGASVLGIGGKADGGEIDGYAGGGALARPRRAAGQLTGTGGKRQDNLLFWGSKGEFMQPAAAVDFYGVEFMEAIRNRRLPKFATGGSLGGGAAPGRPGAFQFNQQIIDKVGVKVTSEEQTLPDGSRLQRLELSEAVNEAMTTPGGAANRTLRRRGVTQPRARR